MMNVDSSAQCNQKNFYNNTYTHADQPSHSLHSSRAHTPTLQDLFDMNGLDMQQSNQNVSMDVLDNLMANASSNSNNGSSPMSTSTASGSQPNQQALIEQQMRLNQLQQLYQLQTQIFQQQIELLSGQSTFGPLSMNMMMDPSRSRDQQQYLPTPAASADLPPQPSPDFVPPMLLQSSSSSQAPPQIQAYNQHPPFMQNNSLQNQLPNPHSQHGTIPSAPHSAPANIVFPNIRGHLGGGSGSNMNSPYGPLPSPADLEFDEMSPLTSPWLGAYNATPSSNTPVPSSNQNQQQGLTDQSVLQPDMSTGMKRRTRTASPGSDEASGSRGRSTRKRQAGVPRLPQPHPPPSSRKATNALRGGTKSANSTPVFPSTHGPIPLTANRPNTRRSATVINGDIPGDSPSPVDLSMPPPAAPATAQQAQLEFLLTNNNPSPTGETPMESNDQPILPVTPSSIMNLGRLGTQSSLTPPIQKPSKKPARQRSATVNSNAASERTPLISPALKPIRPASNTSNTRGSTSPAGPSPAVSFQGQQPPLQVRKTSHKAAEQKRRDSLKFSFDDLRILLPPIPLPSEEGFPDEPILPGAMPPRGPPKGNADGPNRGVSKLQLLRCGNDYIRRLKGRVERRDVEIDLLRREINRLRLAVGSHPEMDEEEETIDMDKDLDACEASLGPLGRSSAGAMDGDEVDDDGGD
ncbi:hypothetical protein BDY19DRAFT_939991 [Irpex rosettiformis]|uniref:Uncharacterized protein n=1 Tax=Irpex rosettiformis TaxID=378272 RepID=A0ACB8U838_9APHY|nr:hypothetical protein BDY19DRAFT_939991 [Irpex rosettiformis]